MGYKATLVHLIVNFLEKYFFAKKSSSSETINLFSANFSLNFHKIGRTPNKRVSGIIGGHLSGVIGHQLSGLILMPQVFWTNIEKFFFVKLTLSWFSSSSDDSSVILIFISEDSKGTALVISILSECPFSGIIFDVGVVISLLPKFWSINTRFL